MAYARHHHSRVADPNGVLRVLEELPEHHYGSMADVEVEVGRIL